MVERFGMIDEASGYSPLYFGKVNDVEDYAIAGEQYVRLTDYEALRARLETVEAETRERCAKVCEDQASQFLSPQYAANQPIGSITERFACEECAAAIRNLEPRHD